MNPKDFMKTVYLGDRACKSILIDGWNNEVKMQIDCISRVRGDQWDFYTEEDLEDGRLVFLGVQSVVVEPRGCLPNSFIDLTLVQEKPNDLYELVFSVGATDSTGKAVMAEITILASKMHLEDKNGKEIIR